jgi:hypothetical protein
MHDPGHKAFSEIAGVKFSIPNNFDLHQPAPAADVAYMYDSRLGIGLYVAVPEKPVNGEYLLSLSKTLAAHVFPKAKDFEWKAVVYYGQGNSVSKFQTASGVSKGLNGKTYIQVDYLAVSAGNREVLIGYVTQSLNYPGSSSRSLFDAEGAGGMSMSAWYAQAHVIASVTGEKYKELSPGTSVTVPVPKKESHPSVDRKLYNAGPRKRVN